MPCVSFKRYKLLPILQGTDEHADFPAIHAITLDGLVFEVDVMVRWSIVVEQITELYRSYPATNWKTITIASVIREDIRHTVSTHTAMELISMRATISLEMEEQLVERLSHITSLKESVTNIEVELRDLSPPDDFLAAINDKLQKEQEMIAADFERQREVIIASGTRAAIEEIMKAGNYTQDPTNIIMLYMWIEALEEVSEDIDYFIITSSGSGIPFVIPIGTDGQPIEVPLD